MATTNESLISSSSSARRQHRESLLGRRNQETGSNSPVSRTTSTTQFAILFAVMSVIICSRQTAKETRPRKEGTQAADGDIPCLTGNLCLFQDGKFSRRMEVWHGVVLAALASWHCTLLTRYYLRRSR